MPIHKLKKYTFGGGAKDFKQSRRVSFGDDTYVPGTGTTDDAGSVGSTGSAQAHNNLPPYLVVYMWTRTA